MLTKIKAFLLKSIRSKKLNVFGLFLLFSFTILVLSKLSKSYTEIITIPVSYHNLPDEIVLTNKEDKTINVTVTTHGFNLLASYFKNSKIAIDFDQDVNQNKNNFIWETKKSTAFIEKQLGSGFEIKSVKPDSMYFPYSVLAIKRVPIKLKVNIEFASGYDSLNNFEIHPDSVNIIGSEEDIKAIRYIETEEVTLKNVKASIDTEVTLLPPKEGKTIKLSQDAVEAICEVEKFTEGTLEVPLIVTNLPPDVDINYFPKSVKVSYEVSLDNYKNVKSSDFRIECNFSANQQSYMIPEVIQKPDFVKRIKLKQNKIEYIIIQ